jgi:hypothetical protein
LKEKVIGHTVWKTRFGRICGEPVVSQTTGLINLLMELNIVLSKSATCFVLVFVSVSDDGRMKKIKHVAHSR